MAAKSLSIKYEYKNVLSDLKDSKDFKATPFFSPIPNVDLSFRFEYLFHESLDHPDGKLYNVSLFRLKLVRWPSSEILASWFMDVDVNILYVESSHAFKKYPIVSSLKIQDINVMPFEDVIRDYSSGFNSVRKYIDKHNSLTLQCHLKIWDDSMNSQSIWNETHLMAELKQFTDDFRSIYDPKILSDIEFKIDEKSIAAHKVVIAAHSPVFLKMLTNDFQESQTNTITISDSSYDQFTIFLKYLYTSEIEDQSWLNVRELYKLADKYDVAVLQRQCQRIILASFSVDRVCEMLIFAYEFDNDTLKKAAIRFAVDHIKDVMCQENWKTFIESYPRIGYDVVVNFAPK